MELAGTVLEAAHWARGRLVVGVDEVGRGAWAGPVSVGAVALDPDDVPDGLADSKLLSAAARDRLAGEVTERAVAQAVGHAGPEEIDELGLAAALRLAAGRALALVASALPRSVDVVLVDGPVDLTGQVPDLARAEVVPVVGGDRISASIAAASIVAKVTRDRLLVAADAEHPGYALAANKGYPSPAHRLALAELGASTIHRRSWRPIAALGAPRLELGAVVRGTGA